MFIPSFSYVQQLFSEGLNGLRYQAAQKLNPQQQKIAAIVCMVLGGLGAIYCVVRCLSKTKCKEIQKKKQDLKIALSPNKNSSPLPISTSPLVSTQEQSSKSMKSPEKELSLSQNVQEIDSSFSSDGKEEQQDDSSKLTPPPAPEASTEERDTPQSLMHSTFTTSLVPGSQTPSDNFPNLDAHEVIKQLFSSTPLPSAIVKETELNEAEGIHSKLQMVPEGDDKEEGCSDASSNVSTDLGDDMNPFVDVPSVYKSLIEPRQEQSVDTESDEHLADANKTRNTPPKESRKKRVTVEGDFTPNGTNGRGKRREGGITSEGKFVNGKLHGNGSQRLRNGTVIKALYDNGEAVDNIIVTQQNKKEAKARRSSFSWFNK